MESFIKRRMPGKTTCSKALQYSSNKVGIKLKLYHAINYTISKKKTLPDTLLYNKNVYIYAYAKKYLN